MKRLLFIIPLTALLVSCAPVLNRELMREGSRNVPVAMLRENPEAYQGKLYIFGGIIVDARLTEKGSVIEALFAPVDSYGYLEETGHSQGRFLAIYPKSKGLLDPMVYKKGREITLAGEFLETRKGKIDEMEYTYPLFEIRQIYLWAERKDYYYAPYYYPYPYWYDPWYPWGWGRGPWPYWPPSPPPPAPHHGDGTHK